MYQDPNEIQHVSDELLCLGVKWESERQQYLIHFHGQSRACEPSRGGIVWGMISIPLWLLFGLFVLNKMSRPMSTEVQAVFVAIVPLLVLSQTMWEWYQLRRFEAAKAHYETKCLRLQQKLDGMDGSWQT